MFVYSHLQPLKFWMLPGHDKWLPTAHKRISSDMSRAVPQYSGSRVATMRVNKLCLGSASLKAERIPKPLHHHSCDCLLEDVFFVPQLKTISLSGFYAGGLNASRLAEKTRKLSQKDCS